MKKISRNEQILVVVLFGVMALFFFIKKVYDPLSKEISELVKKNNELVASISELQDEPIGTDKIERKIKRVSSSISSEKEAYNQLVYSTLAGREQVQEVALEISGLASDNGLTVREMIPDDDAAETLTADFGVWQKGFELIPYVVKMEGDFLDFQTFLHEFVSMDIQLLLGSLRVESVDDQGTVIISGTILI